MGRLFKCCNCKNENTDKCKKCVGFEEFKSEAIKEPQKEMESNLFICPECGVNFRDIGTGAYCPNCGCCCGGVERRTGMNPYTESDWTKEEHPNTDPTKCTMADMEYKVKELKAEAEEARKEAEEKYYKLDERANHLIFMLGEETATNDRLLTIIENLTNGSN